MTAFLSPELLSSSCPLGSDVAGGGGQAPQESTVQKMRSLLFPQLPLQGVSSPLLGPGSLAGRPEAHRYPEACRFRVHRAGPEPHHASWGHHYCCFFAGSTDVKGLVGRQ